MRGGLLTTGAILNLNAEGIVTAHCGLESIFGYGPGEAVGRDFSFLFPQEGIDGWKTLLEGAASAPVKELMVKMLRKDRSAIDLSLSIYAMAGLKSGPSSYTCMLAFGRPAPPGMPSEEFDRIFKFSNDAVMITGSDGDIMDVNPAFCDTYGWSREEVCGRNLKILISPHSGEEIYEKMQEDILDPAKGFWRGELINAARDGREIPVLLSLNAIKDESGEVRNLLGIAQNISRQKELDRIQKMYLDYVIHDIRGPLTTITINAELLLMKLEDVPEKARRKINMIIESARKIRDMTSDVLDFSRARNGSLPLNREKIDAARILRQAAAPFEHSGKSLYINGVGYGEAPPEGITVEADGGKLQRIMYNLLSNAFKYAESEVRISIGADRGGFRFAVSDDGRGIAREEGRRIFEAFYQTEDGVKAGGSGLGLNIVKSFVEAHGGRVWIDAVQPRGVTFGFSLP